MKKIILSLLTVILGSMQAQALSVERSREEARFLTDKMAYELDLTDDQIQDIYEINYDYFRSLGPVDGFYDSYYNRRYQDLHYVLYGWQWTEFLAREYFLRPVVIYRGGWVFSIYNYYHRTHFYFGIPACYHHYHGGHYHRPAYYRNRVAMHRRAVTNRPRPTENRRPQMTRPNQPGRSNSTTHRRTSTSVRSQNNNGTRVRGNGSQPSSTRVRTGNNRTEQTHIKASRTERKRGTSKRTTVTRSSSRESRSAGNNSSQTRDRGYRR